MEATTNSQGDSLLRPGEVLLSQTDLQRLMPFGVGLTGGLEFPCPTWLSSSVKEDLALVKSGMSPELFLISPADLALVE